MKKFISKTALMFLPILLGAILLEILLRQLPNDYKYKKYYLDNHSNKIETLILGNSHAFFGIDPIYFSNKTFNAGEVAQSLNFDYEVFKKYQRDFKNLKTIVLPISYISLYSSLEEDQEAWRIKNYVLYYDIIKPQSITDFTEIFSNKLETNLRRLASVYIKGNPSVLCNELGWGTTYKSEKARDLFETGKVTSSKHSKDIVTKEAHLRYENNMKILNEFAQWSQSNNVKLILFTPPAFKSYRENLNPEQLNRTIEAAIFISSKYDNCEYYNFLSDTTFVAKDFYDADHLSEIGAKKLSNIINKKIIEEK